MREDKPKALSLFSLVMINIIAVDSLRTLPVGAEFGFALVFFYLLAALVFFVPTALIAAELATGWPTEGGAYVWVREAFGPRWGFTVIWLQWVYNVVWYPTILAFVAGMFADLFEPQWINSKAFMLVTVLILFWAATLVGLLGMRVSGWISTAGALFGTLVPMAAIIVLGIVWVVEGRPLHVDLSLAGFLPSARRGDSPSYLVALLFGLIGLEMSAVHAKDVRDPGRDYPRAQLYSALIILVTLVAASLSIALVVPKGTLSLVGGIHQALSIFLKAYGLGWMIPVLIGMIILGALSCMSAWIVGPTRGLLVALEDTNVPQVMRRVNRWGAPATLLLIQALLVTAMAATFLLMPAVSSSYWILTALTSQMALLFYVLLFASAIKLRYSRPDVVRAYRIPGGNAGIWLVGGVGIVFCAMAIGIGFLPPADLNVGSLLRYEVILGGGLFGLGLLPLLVIRPPR